MSVERTIPFTSFLEHTAQDAGDKIDLISDLLVAIDQIEVVLKAVRGSLWGKHKFWERSWESAVQSRAAELERLCGPAEEDGQELD